MEHSRRDFLKASGLAALGTTVVNAELKGQTAESSGGTAAAANPDSTDLAALVNILQGTDSNYYFSRGNTLPIAAMPFGMAHWTLQSRSGTPWMFQPGDRRIQGFRCTHQLSPWLSDYGHAIFLPFSGEPKLEPDARSSSYRPEEAELHPYALRLNLLRYRADVELVATERCCVLTANFADSGPRGLLFEVPGKSGTMEPDDSRKAVRFESTANAGGVPDNFATYYVLQLSEPWQNFEVREVGGNRVGVLRFEAVQTVRSRRGSRLRSFRSSRPLGICNRKSEIDRLRNCLQRGKETWNTALARIEIEGATDQQRRTFYSCLYRALLFPRTWHEPDENGNPRHFSAFNGKVMPGVMYADHGYWDVYRAWYPFMSLVYPERLGEILAGVGECLSRGRLDAAVPCAGLSRLHVGEPDRLVVRRRDCEGHLRLRSRTCV